MFKISELPNLRADTRLWNVPSWITMDTLLPREHSFEELVMCSEHPVNARIETNELGDMKGVASLVSNMQFRKSIHLSSWHDSDPELTHYKDATFDIKNKLSVVSMVVKVSRISLF